MITILLASYNGQRFIAEQLDSLLSQTVPADRIVISDDGSTDNTFNIIAEYTAKYPKIITIKRNDTGRGAWRNFLGMMCKERDNYIMLSDQDDIWLPDKTEKTLAALQKAEQEYGSDIPIVAHTDLAVADETLNIYAPSFFQLMDVDYSHKNLNDRIVQNIVTGCTAMYNRTLADLIVEMPDYCIMHDWWLLLLAVCFGKVVTLNEPTILYRQHDGNGIGAKDARSVSYLLQRVFARGTVRQSLNRTYIQAASLLSMYGERMSEADRSFLEAYTQIPSYGKAKRLREMHRLGIRKNSFVRQLGQIIYG